VQVEEINIVEVKFEPPTIGVMQVQKHQYPTNLLG